MSIILVAVDVVIQTMNDANDRQRFEIRFPKLSIQNIAMLGIDLNFLRMHDFFSPFQVEIYQLFNSYKI